LISSLHFFLWDLRVLYIGQGFYISLKMLYKRHGALGTQAKSKIFKKVKFIGVFLLLFHKCRRQKQTLYIDVKMVNQYFVIHISVLLLLDIFFEGKIEETGKQPKRGEPTQIRIWIWNPDFNPDPIFWLNPDLNLFQIRISNHNHDVII
jgi:hypothetical protein